MLARSSWEAMGLEEQKETREANTDLTWIGMGYGTNNEDDRVLGIPKLLDKVRQIDFLPRYR